MLKSVKNNWISFLAITLGLGVSEVAIAESGCVSFPRQSSNPVVEACETEFEYDIRIGENSYVFDKEIFQDRIKHAAMTWLTTRAPSATVDSSSLVDIWLAVPESDPLAAQGRVMVRTSHGNVVFYFDIKSSNWVFSDSSTAILNDKSYPTSFGHRPASILAKPTPGAPVDSVIHALLESGAIDATYDNSGSYRGVAVPFQELNVANRALKSHAEFLERVQVNTIFEWIADRQKIFEFRFISHE